MLSKPLALQSVRMHRPRFWQCERAGLKSYCLYTVTKKALCICWCRQIKWLWFRFFQRSGTFPLSSTHFLCEAQSLRWVLLATDIGLSWEAVIIILTVPEHTGATVDTKYWAAPGVWAKLRKTHKRKALAFVNVSTTYARVLYTTPQGFISFSKLKGMKSPHEDSVHSAELV